MRNIARPAKQFPAAQAKSSNQPISFETNLVVEVGQQRAARCVNAAIFSDRDLTGDGEGVGACAYAITGNSIRPRKIMNRRDTLVPISIPTLL